jgi:hypothetical protein
MHIHLPETIDVQMRQEPIVIPAPVVNVPAPVVNVTVDPTPIEVAAPVVNVAAPEVTVNVPTVPVQLSMEMPESEPETEGPERKKVTFRRDKDGRIISAELVEED